MACQNYGEINVLDAVLNRPFKRTICDAVALKPAMRKATGFSHSTCYHREYEVQNEWEFHGLDPLGSEPTALARFCNQWIRLVAACKHIP